MWWKRQLKCVAVGVTLLLTSLVFFHVADRYIFTNLSANEQLVFQILSWNMRTDKNAAGWREGFVSSKTFDDPSCKCNLNPQHICYHTYDRSKYKSSHAVLFNAHAYWMEAPYDTPQTRPSGQKWVFFQMESTVRTHSKVEPNFNRLFNVTATYRFDSDVQISYGSVCASNNTSSTNNPPYETEELKIVSAQIENKTGLIAWFVSNCRTPSRREDYVNELKRYVPVHVYGKCGDMQFNTSGSWDAELNMKYKFYLAFENSLCEDYVTEKFFRMRPLNVVPIVMGGGDYSKYSPQGTFINVKDFSSARHLADYILLLDSREDLYAEYLLRKRAAICQPMSNFLCSLCDYLHVNAHREQSIVLSEYWNKSKQCEVPK